MKFLSLLLGIGFSLFSKDIKLLFSIHLGGSWAWYFDPLDLRRPLYFFVCTVHELEIARGRGNGDES